MFQFYSMLIWKRFTRMKRYKAHREICWSKSVLWCYKVKSISQTFHLAQWVNGTVWRNRLCSNPRVRDGEARRGVYVHNDIRHTPSQAPSPQHNYPASISTNTPHPPVINIHQKDLLTSLHVLWPDKSPTFDIHCSYCLMEQSLRVPHFTPAVHWFFILIRTRIGAMKTKARPLWGYIESIPSIYTIAITDVLIRLCERCIEAIEGRCNRSGLIDPTL